MHGHIQLFNDALEVSQSTKNNIFALKKIHLSLATVHNQIKFLQRCKNHNVIPKSFHLKLPFNSKGSKRVQQSIGKILTKECISHLYAKMKRLFNMEMNVRKKVVMAVYPEDWKIIWNYVTSLEKQRFMDIREKLMLKFDSLLSHQSTALNGGKSQHSENSKNRIVNLSSKTISSTERKVLGKGLGFIPRINKVNMFNVAAESEVTAKQDTLESIPTIVKSIVKNKDFGRRNLSGQEISAIDNLSKDKSIVIQYSDKGKNVVILNKSEYDKKIEAIVNSDSYVKLSGDPTDQITKKLDKIFKTYQKTKDFPKRLSLQLKTGFFRHPAIYGQTKIHKENYPLRPIISNYQTILEASAKYISNALRRYTKCLSVSTTVNNSVQVINALRNIHVKNSLKLISFDVVNLFGSLDIDQCIELVRGLINNDVHVETELQVPKGFLIEIFILCLKTSYFMYNNEFYEQSKGVPMGSSLSPVVADIFMTFFEIQILNLELAKCVLSWKRYVDDVLCLWDGNDDDLKLFLAKMNSFYPSIQFTMEMENENSLNFLDVKILKHDDRLSFEMYSKPTDSGIMTNFNSFNPPHIKSNIVKSQVLRVGKITDDFEKDSNNLKEKFVNNGYPNSLVNQTIEKFRNNKGICDKKENKKENFLKNSLILPYMGKTTKRLKKATANLDVKIISKNNPSLENMFSKNYKYSTRVDSGVIYKINCSCGEFYIGETGRNLKTRIKEHKNAIRLNYTHYALTRHINNNFNHVVDFDNVEILGRECKLECRKIKEAMFINDLKPTINLNQGVELKEIWDDILPNKK